MKTINVINEVQIPVDIMSEVQRLNYEVEGLKVLLITMYRSKFNEFSKDIIREKEIEYHNLNMEFSLLRDEVIGSYIPKEYRAPNMNYTFLFSESLIQIFNAESGVLCNEKCNKE